MAQDPYGRVACETAVKTGFVLCLGEITTKASINFDELVRKVILDIGFDCSNKGFDGNTCGVQVAIAAQSPDIAMGVDKAQEFKTGEMSEDEIEAIGAGDQGMMFGFACDETPTLMPMPIYLAHKLARRLSEVRKQGILPWLRPDGKTQVTVEYSYGKPKRIHTVLISTQHDPEIGQQEIRHALIEHVIDPVLPGELVDKDLIIYTNPTGRFVVGGPMGDAGLTARLSSTPTAAWGDTAAAPSPARIAPKSIAAPPTPRAGWRRTSSPPGWRRAAKFRLPTPSAWRIL